MSDRDSARPRGTMSLWTNGVKSVGCQWLGTEWVWSSQEVHLYVQCMCVCLSVYVIVVTWASSVCMVIVARVQLHVPRAEPEGRHATVLRLLHEGCNTIPYTLEAHVTGDL